MSILEGNLSTEFEENGRKGHGGHFRRKSDILVMHITKEGRYLVLTVPCRLLGIEYRAVEKPFLLKNY